MNEDTKKSGTAHSFIKGIKYEEVQDSQNEIIAKINTTSVDRDNEIALPSGVRRDGKMPVVLLFHDHTKPIGKAQWIKYGKDEIVAKAKINTEIELGRDAMTLVRAGVLSQTSVGFIAFDWSKPTEKEVKRFPEWKNVSAVIRDWELLEFSLVPVPSNRDADIIAVSKELGLSEGTVKRFEDIRIKSMAQTATKNLVDAGGSKKSIKDILYFARKEIERSNFDVSAKRIIEEVNKNLMD